MADEDLPPDGGEDEALDGAIGEGEEQPELQEGDQGPEASDEDRLAESLAAELGWSPKDKWRGPEEDWKPASAFLKTTIEVNKARGKEIKSLHERVDRIARTSAAMADRAAADERAKWEAAHAQAVEEGDPQAALKASQEIQRLATPAPDNVVTEFAERNKSWLGIDPIATAMVHQIGEVCARNGMDAAQQVEEAEKVIRKRFPEYFEDTEPKPRAKTPGAEVPQSRTARPLKSGPKGFADLPPEAKAAAADFERRGRATKEEYAAEYWKENA